MTPEILKELLDRYSRGQCSEKEKRFVHEWFENINSEDQSIPDDLQERLWSNIKAQNNIKDNQRWLFAKVAASLLILVAVSALFFTLTKNKSQVVGANDTQVNESLLVPAVVKNTIANNGTVPEKVTLEDGSVVTLEPGSHITIPDKFSSSERVVSLVGQAFFNIKRDTLRPFYVYSREVVTKVLGTSFTIKALESDKQITVSVKTGKVSVFTNPIVKQPSATAVILTPNQQAVYDRRDIVVTKEIVEKPEVILEKPTIFAMKYDETPVTEIFDMMEQNYGVDIQYDHEMLKGCVLTTKMSDEGLFERIEVICRAINASFNQKDGVILIEGKGCQ